MSAPLLPVEGYNSKRNYPGRSEDSPGYQKDQVILKRRLVELNGAEGIEKTVLAVAGPGQVRLELLLHFLRGETP